MLFKWKYSRHLRSLHTSPVSASNLLARKHLSNFHYELFMVHLNLSLFPNQRFMKLTQVGRRNCWYKDNVDRNVVSDEALTSVTSSSLLKLKLVTDQINDDHNDAEENNPWKSSNYALFLLMKRTMYNTKLKLFCELTSQIK